MKTCVLIPTYNESLHIASLIEEIKPYIGDIVVIDDGSSDATAEIARRHGATVIQNTQNQGKGRSLAIGFQYCMKKGVEAILTMDGDGQHLPTDIPRFLSAAKNLDAGIILGNRLANPKGMPLVRLITNHCMSWIISKISHQKIPDTQCGFRLMKKKAIESIRLTTSNYETESEILIQAAKNGITILSVPITVVYQGDTSKINPFIDTVRFLKFILRQFCWANSENKK